ncbi:unnamed protein product, partial [Mesorhabditis spiculigera]
MAPSKLLNEMPNSVLDRIIGFIPLRERCSQVTLVSKNIHDSVERTIKNVSFFMEGMDRISDESLDQFLKLRGQHLTHINLDLYRSVSRDESTQWAWRQSILKITSSCVNLTELDLMICNRHKLRDKDLEAVFKSCKKLETLRFDAQFVNGNSFKFAPPLKRLEMEMCIRINDNGINFICSRMQGLRTLYVSQLLILKDSHLFKLVKSLKKLRDLAIVSHVETKYEGLSGFGLCSLTKLPLRTLVVEGIAAATDQFLQTIANPESKIFTQLQSLSIAFCFNISMHGLKRLTPLPQLRNLNLDGFQTRDISLGIEEISSTGNLQRLFIADDTNITPEALVRIVKNSPKLCVLDLVKNKRVLTAETANEWISFWEQSNRPPLYVLTNDHKVWNDVNFPSFDSCGRRRVVIIHLALHDAPLEEIAPSTAITFESPNCLPSGILYAKIRCGNRYRLLFQSLGDGQLPKIENNENQGRNAGKKLKQVPQRRSEPPIPEFRPFLPVNDADLFRPVLTDNSRIFNVPALGNLNPAIVSADLFKSPGWPTDLQHKEPEFSSDVLELLLSTHAYEDGAWVGNNLVMNGLLHRPDGTLQNPTYPQPTSRLSFPPSSADPHSIWSPLKTPRF